jgi:hypothetical protein
MVLKTRTIKIEEKFCDICGAEIDEHFNEPLGKCDECKRDICPRCIGIYKAEVSKFKGYSGTALPIETLSKTLCLDCGTKFEAKLIEAGLIYRRVSKK